MRVPFGAAGQFLIVLCAFGMNASAAAGQAQWIVVTAPAFRKAVEPLCQHRKSQGFHVVIVQTTDVLSRDDLRAGRGFKLREHIKKLCRDHCGRSYVLLVGAYSAADHPAANAAGSPLPGGGHPAANAAGSLGNGEPAALAAGWSKVVPALSGTIGRMKGQPSDNGYGCLDDGRLPAVAVGRFPARNEQEARGMVAKTLDYERATPPPSPPTVGGEGGGWRRRLIILAGIPAYNPLVDRLVEGLALARLSRLSPMWAGRAIYSNPQSRFCLPDDRLHQRALQYVQGGEAFILYLGHSSAEGLYGGRARYLDRDDWSQMRIPRGKGVFITFGCCGCQLKGDDGEGYGLAAIRNPNGPVAVAGSHGICFAAMVQLAADGLFESTFAGTPSQRLGDSWLAVKNGLANGKIDDLTFRLLDAVDGNKSIPQATQRQEHLEMFVLLGDPALRLPQMPEDIEVNTEKSVSPGGKLSVSGKVPARLAGAHLRLTLERTVNSAPEDLEALPTLSGSERSNEAIPARQRAMLVNHERANRFVLAASETTVKDGHFQATLDVPAKLPWPNLILRVYAANECEEGMAVRMLRRSCPNRSREP